MAVAERAEVGALRHRLHQGRALVQRIQAQSRTRSCGSIRQTEKFQSWAIPGGGDIVRNMDVTPDGNPVTANSLTNQVGLIEIK